MFSKIPWVGAVLFSLTLFLVAVSSPAVSGSSFVRGDIDQNGELNLSDPILLLTYLFVDGRTAVDCLDAADVNDSGGLDITDAIHGLSFLFLGGQPPAPPFPECGEDPTEDEVSCGSFLSAHCSSTAEPSGRLVFASECKSLLRGTETPVDEECVRYEYAEGGVLHLQHLNAGFNCCADPQADISVTEGVIRIEEYETFAESPCHCLCLFDLELEIEDLPPGEHSIEVSGPLAELEFTVDLLSSPSGSYCVRREQYPWGL